MKKHFPIIIEQDEDGVYLVECPAFRGCRSYGNTIDEAIENIQEAIKLCLEEVGREGKNTTFVGVRDIEVALQ